MSAETFAKYPKDQEAPIIVNEADETDFELVDTLGEYSWCRNITILLLSLSFFLTWNIVLLLFGEWCYCPFWSYPLGVAGAIGWDRCAAKATRPMISRVGPRLKSDASLRYLPTEARSDSPSESVEKDPVLAASGF